MEDRKSGIEFIPEQRVFINHGKALCILELQERSIEFEGAGHPWPNPVRNAPCAESLEDALAEDLENIASFLIGVSIRRLKII